MSIRCLSPDLQEVAERKLNEVPGRIPEDLHHIKEWLTRQHHLRARKDDQWLLAFLRYKKFSLEQTKTRLDFFYTMKTVAPEIMQNKDPFSVGTQEFLKDGFCLTLPKTCNSAGPRVIIFSMPKSPNMEIYTASVVVQAATMIGDIMTAEDDNFIVMGTQVIIDLANFPYEAIGMITPTVIKTAILLMDQAYPLEIKQVYVVNIPKFMLPIISLVMTFVPHKYKERIYFFAKNSICEVYKHIPRSILPYEYGGDGGPMRDIRDQVKAKVESYYDWFREEGDYYSDETKRPGKPVTSSDLLGIDGSFRKIEVD